MTKYQKESQLLLLLAFFERNPGATLSIAYMLLTLCGIFYSLGFYGQFDVEILKLASMSDLMIIGISEPAAVLMFSGGLLIAYITDVLSQLSYDTKIRWQNKPRSIKRFFILMIVYAPRTKATAMFFFLLMFTLYSYLFVSLYAEWKSEQVKLGKGPQVSLSVESKSRNRQVTLLGTTSHFVLTYDHIKNQTSIHAVENVEMTLSAKVQGE